jgi:hypothetical protein
LVEKLVENTLNIVWVVDLIVEDRFDIEKFVVE